MCSYLRRHVVIFFVILVVDPPDILLGSIFNVPGGVIGTLEAGVGALVSVGVAAVDVRAIPWSGYTTPVSLFVCTTSGSISVSSSLRESFQKFLIFQEGQDELGLGGGKFRRKLGDGVRNSGCRRSIC